MSDDDVRCPCVVVSVIRLHHIPILLLVLVLVLEIVFFVSLFRKVLLSLHLPRKFRLFVFWFRVSAIMERGRLPYLLAPLHNATPSTRIFLLHCYMHIYILTPMDSCRTSTPPLLRILIRY